MGGGAMPEQGHGKKGKKSLDAVINVVPAIDLLSCCITFLLYTAVWTQIARLQVNQFGSGAPEPPGEQQKTMLVTLLVGERGMTLQTTSGVNDEIPLVPRAMKKPKVPKPEDQLAEEEKTKLRQDVKTLGDKLKVLRASNPDAVSVTIAPEDTIPYRDIIEVIDTCMGQGFASVTMAGG